MGVRVREWSKDVGCREGVVDWSGGDWAGAAGRCAEEGDWGEWESWWSLMKGGYEKMGLWKAKLLDEVVLPAKEENGQLIR